MFRPLDIIKGRISGGSKSKIKEDDLIQIRHDLMLIYGWIPLNEFKQITIPELWDLYELVQKEKKIMYTAYQSMMSFAGMKRGKIQEVFR